MIDKVKFIKAMEYLTLAYPNSKIEVENKNMMSVWYDVLKDFDHESFTALLKEYVKQNVYPPQSPAHLTEYAKQEITKSINAADVFEKLITRIRDNRYDLDRVIEKYERGGQLVVSKTIRELYSNFKLWFSDVSQLPFLKRDFIQAYERNLVQKVGHDVSRGQLTDVKLLGGHDGY